MDSTTDCQLNGYCESILAIGETGMTQFSNPLTRWNERFSTESYLFGEKPNKYLAEKTPHLQKGKALSIADGEGRNSV
jgi:hypothetical protein